MAIYFWEVLSVKKHAFYLENVSSYNAVYHLPQCLCQNIISKGIIFYLFLYFNQRKSLKILIYAFLYSKSYVFFFIGLVERWNGLLEKVHVSNRLHCRR
ncbi:hypothetical protein QBC38DRAFT_78153 [Podospora fimiseda]|uniref:Uncharacterized protein n=1 Tax=Podospora fimiseda TaxID=252190 RepID=A0AAN7H6K4_9PEZI|nr:hypothetical protein QBC38DRAFT_78153 [Podospora fimiseda]